jgi:hypothetical protein
MSKTYGIRALARALKCSTDTIRRAIDNNSIPPDAVVDDRQEWKLESIEAMMAAKKAPSLRDEKTREEIRKLRIQNDRNEGKVVLRTEIATKLRTALGRMRGVLEQKVINELPTAVAGLEPPQVRVKARQILDEAMSECQPLEAEL